jgi:hypothetical protein
MIRTVFQLIALFLATNAYAQYDIRDIANESSIIVEGKIVEKISFMHSDGYIYTNNRIEVYIEIKNEFQETVIEIVTKGGVWNGINQSWSHDVTIPKNSYGMFFLQPSRLFEDSYNLTKEYYGYINYRNLDNGIIEAIAPGLKSTNIGRDLYNPLREITGSISVMKFTESEQSNIMNIEGFGTDSLCVEYSISNIQIIPVNSFVSSSNYNIDFDIHVKSLTDPFLLYSTELIMEYSSNVLGTNIINNNRMSANLTGDFADYDLTLSDYATNKVKISIVKEANKSAIEINSFRSSLYHATIHVENVNIQDVLSISVDENFELETLVENPSGGIDEIQCNYYNEDIDVNIVSLLTPSITEYNNIVTAGTRTLLIIEGTNFGVNQGDNEVWFKNAWNADIDEWIKPPIGDYKSWSSTKVEVYVPSFGMPIDDNIAGVRGRYYAGSGKFKIYNANGSDSEEKDLSVQYAVANDIFLSQSQPIFLNDENGNGTYTITYSTAFKNKIGINGNKFTDAFERALNTWCTETGLNYIVDPSAYPNGDFDVLVDIDFPTNFGPTASTMTQIYDAECSIEINNGSFNHPETFLADIFKSGNAIVFHDNILGGWDAGPIMNSDLNVEQTLLHELGHLHGLYHTNNIGDLMYYNPTSTSISNLDGAGSFYLQNMSASHNCQSGPYTFASSCTTNTKEEFLENKCSIFYNGSDIVIENSNNIEFIEATIYSTEGILLLSSNVENNRIITLDNFLKDGIYLVVLQSKFGRNSYKLYIAK